MTANILLLFHVWSLDAVIVRLFVRLGFTSDEKDKEWNKSLMFGEIVKHLRARKK
jgi:hypothetical protein